MARSLRLSLVVVTLALLGARAGYCLQTPTLPVSQVRAGQRAVAKSVFRGTKIESFHIEIIGVLHKYDGTRDLILGKVLDGPVAARKSGIIAGMSGSPVYIGGKLIGAIAYAWSWSKEPIAGITPIGEMLEAWQSQPGAKVSAGGSGLDRPIEVAGHAVSRVRVGSGFGQPELPGTMTLTPLSGFVQASGFNQRALGQLSELLSPYGLQVVAGPSGGTESMRPPLVAGASLGAQLVGGDFDISALGTITLVEGKRVLAFGHPLFGLGDIDVPMSGGYVYDIMPSLAVSNKIMTGTQVIGRVSRDTQTAIAGDVGAKSDLLPMTIEVTDRDLRKSRQFHVTIARLRELTPSLAGMSVMTAIDETRGRMSRGTARVITEVEAEGRPMMRREDFNYSEGDVAMTAMMAVMRPLSMFTESPFGKLRFRQVRVRVEVQQERKTASIERVTIPHSRVKAGDEVALAVTVRPYGADLVEIPVKVKLPLDLPRGQVRLVVSGGAEADEARASIGAPKPAPVSLGQLIDRYLTQDSRQDLVVQVALTRGGVALLGEELPDLPRGPLEALRAAHPTDLRPAASVMKTTVPTEWALSGRQMVTLSVESSIAPAAPAPPPPPGREPQQPGGAPEEEGQIQEEFDALEAGGTASLSGLGFLTASPTAAGPKQPAKKEQPKEKEEESKPLTRAPQAWVQEHSTDYAQAKLNDVALAEDGRVTLGLNRVELAKVPADAIWSLAVRDGNVFVGSGTEGAVYKISEKGEVSRFFATGEMNVNALAFDKEGSLYAATSPRGRLFKIAPDGTGKVLYDSDSAHLWCLVVDPDGKIYAGAGSPARVYAIDPAGTGKVLAELPGTNVLSLVRAPSGDLYAGTADSGVVFRVRPDGTAAAIGRVSSNEVSALAWDEKGDLLAAASPIGDIYRMQPGGPLKLYAETSEKQIHGLALMPNGDLIAATGPAGLLLRVGADARPETILRPETGIATALAVVDGSIYLGSTGPSMVRKLGPGYALFGTLESAVLDAERPARWGHAETMAQAPPGTSVTVETRSGDSPNPEDNWTAWTPTSEGLVASPQANHLQFRMKLGTTDPKLTPVVQQVRIAYQPANLPPSVALKAPGSGERIQKKYTVKWEARDPDKDTLVFTLAASRDLGKNWVTLKQDLTEPKYDWDTTPTGDGQLLLRVTASDRQSAPADPKEDADSIVVWVDNTPPQVMLLRSSLVVSGARTVAIKGDATDKLSAIRSVEYRVDEGEWRSLPLSAIDARASSFAIETDPLSPGKHSVEARAFDAAGNSGSDKVEAEVKGAATPAAKGQAKEKPKPAEPEKTGKVG